MTIGIICAMPQEAKELHEAMDNATEEHIAECAFISGTLAGREVVLTNGQMGAAATTTVIKPNTDSAGRQVGYQQKLWQIQSRFAEDCPFLCLYWRMGNVLTRYMYTTARDVREYELLRGIESFRP